MRSGLAYYNEIDPYAAQWLRNLIQAGHIADGEVDTRSIVDVSPDDLRGFTQCHFFAGIGVWSYALRLAGWSDDRPVWTGSCPCQPFSSAGKGAGFNDPRHLWPIWHGLIRERAPRVVFGEQVASKDGLAWLDLVHADMETAHYALGALDLCAAGVGAPHIRQRLYFAAQRVADNRNKRWEGRLSGGQGQEWKGLDGHSGCDRSTSELADASDERCERHSGNGWQAQRRVKYTGELGGLADAKSGGNLRQCNSGEFSERFDNSEVNRLADADQGERGRRADREERQPDGQAGGWIEGDGVAEHDRAAMRPGPTNGAWRDPDWLLCRDGKWRPVEPSTFPLAHGIAGRVGRLRAYGNAIVPQVAAEMIKAYMEVERSII